jgi:hypothetical protein
MSELEDAKKRLADFIAHITLAMNMAKIDEPDGKVGLAVIAIKEDGSGSMSARFEGDEFVNDIITVLGYKDFDDLVLSQEGNEDLKKEHEELQAKKNDASV